MDDDFNTADAVSAVLSMLNSAILMFPARTARLFGTALLTKGAESVNQKSFRTYDRMLPAQDHMPVGGLGNLIALPLQGQALKKGNSAFIDQDWNVYPNQWQQLQNVKKLSKEFIDTYASEDSYYVFVPNLIDERAYYIASKYSEEQKR